jgi:hypothetical protein
MVCRFAGAARTLPRVTKAELFERIETWTYRIGVFVLLNVLDDPAWLAMIFC